MLGFAALNDRKGFSPINDRHGPNQAGTSISGQSGLGNFGRFSHAANVVSAAATQILDQLSAETSLHKGLAGLGWLVDTLMRNGRFGSVRLTPTNNLDRCIGCCCMKDLNHTKLFHAAKPCLR